VSRSKGQRSGSPGPLMLTHIVRHIFRMARPTNLKLGIRMEDNDPHQPQRHDLQGQRSRSQGHVISLSHVGPMAHKSKRIVVVSPKLAGWYPARVMTRATLRTSFKVKRSKYRVTGRLTQTHKMCHIFRPPTLPPLGYLWDVMFVWRKGNIEKTVSLLQYCVLL